MKNKIKEVQDYFKGRIMSGDFKITNRDGSVFDIDIDGAFFQLHMIKHYKVASVFVSSKPHFIKMEELSEDEKRNLYSVIHPMVVAYLKSIADEMVKEENDRHELELQKICDLSK